VVHLLKGWSGRLLEVNPAQTGSIPSLVAATGRAKEDRALLNARNMAETIIGHIKEFSSLNLSKHRSAINAFVHIIAAITAYQINPSSPSSTFNPAIVSKPQLEKPLSGLM
jgi:hypothetical protein